MPATIHLANGDSIDTPKWHRQRMKSLAMVRQPFLPVMDSIQRHIIPILGRTFVHGKKANETMNTDDVIDTTGTQALKITSAGMMAGISSPARKWINLMVSESHPGQGISGRWTEWLQHANDALFSFWDESDLYDMLAGIYLEMPAFGTAAGFGTEVPGQIPGQDFVWRLIPGGEYVIGENAMGRVDTIYRTLNLTVNQMVERYAEKDNTGKPIVDGNLSDAVSQMYRNGDWDESVEVVQYIGPTPFITRPYDEEKYQEVVFEMNAPGKDHVEGGFLSRTLHRVMPAFCGRWSTNGKTPWGMSPGMEALPDVIQLQEMEEKKSIALTLQINPPLQGPPELQRVTSLPGDINFIQGIKASGGLMPVYQVQPNLADYATEMELIRARIRRTFHSDLFLAFIERPGIQPLNESEIWERKEEKLLGLGQVMDRLDREILRPIVEISMDYLFRSGRLDSPPEDMEDVDLEYLNVIAVAQKTQGLTAISDTVSFASTLAEKQAAVGLAPTAMDHLNEREIINGFAKRRGADMRILLDEDEVEELQAQRAQAQAQQAEMAAQQQAAATAKDMAAAEELASRTIQDQGPLATGGGPGNLPPGVV